MTVKNLTVEELRELLRGKCWGSFVSKRSSLTTGGVLFRARYGYFLRTPFLCVLAQHKFVVTSKVDLDYSTAVAAVFLPYPAPHKRNERYMSKLNKLKLDATKRMHKTGIS